uniref:Uncharacterized protein n=1 Tax=Romanomermis culicivorax TaxID=13658 RepID=A0A915KUH1_ROMCU
MEYGEEKRGRCIENFDILVQMSSRERGRHQNALNNKYYQIFYRKNKHYSPQLSAMENRKRNTKFTSKELCFFVECLAQQSSVLENKNGKQKPAPFPLKQKRPGFV